MIPLDFNGTNTILSIKTPYIMAVSFTLGGTKFEAEFTKTIWHEWFGWKTDVQVRCFLTGKQKGFMGEKGKLLPTHWFTIKCKKTED